MFTFGFIIKGSSLQNTHKNSSTLIFLYGKMKLETFFLNINLFFASTQSSSYSIFYDVDDC